MYETEDYWVQLMWKNPCTLQRLQQRETEETHKNEGFCDTQGKQDQLTNDSEV